MNKLLVVAVLVALLAVSSEGFRVLRQVEDEEGPWTRMMNFVRSSYDKTVNTASGYLDSIRGFKLEEKAKNFYDEITTVVTTYVGIAHDQVYHSFYAPQ